MISLKLISDVKVKPHGLALFKNYECITTEIIDKGDNEGSRCERVTKTSKRHFKYGQYKVYDEESKTRK